MLSVDQLRRLTDCTVRLHLAGDLRELGRAASEAMGDLIPCDWPVVSLATTHFPSTRHSFSPASGPWDAYAQEFLSHAHEDPVYTNRLRLLLDGAACASDFAERGSIERTGVFNDVWKPLGATNMLRFITPGRFGFRLEVARSSKREFTRMERAILDTLGRHLDAATERLVVASGGAIPVDGKREPVQTFCWLVCDRAGRVLRATADAKRLMRACVGPTAPLDRIPEPWLRELRRRSGGAPANPAWYHLDGRVVSVHIAPIRPTVDEFSVGFLERPVTSDPALLLVRKGLTRREADVLRWVAEGKTNAEVGIILGISALTVKKHLENVYDKFGVENRTSAVIIALEAMRSAPGVN